MIPTKIHPNKPATFWKYVEKNYSTVFYFILVRLIILSMILKKNTKKTSSVLAWGRYVIEFGSTT